MPGAGSGQRAVNNAQVLSDRKQSPGQKHEGEELGFWLPQAGGGADRPGQRGPDGCLPRRTPRQCPGRQLRAHFLGLARAR